MLVNLARTLYKKGHCFSYVENHYLKHFVMIKNIKKRLIAESNNLLCCYCCHLARSWRQAANGGIVFQSALGMVRFWQMVSHTKQLHWSSSAERAFDRPSLRIHRKWENIKQGNKGKKVTLLIIHHLRWCICVVWNLLGPSESPHTKRIPSRSYEKWIRYNKLLLSSNRHRFEKQNTIRCEPRCFAL